MRSHGGSRIGRDDRHLATRSRSQIAQITDALHRTVAIRTDIGIGLIADRATGSGPTAYDTGYMILAERLDASLLTGKAELARIASEAGLGVVAP